MTGRIVQSLPAGLLALALVGLGAWGIGCGDGTHPGEEPIPDGDGGWFAEEGESADAGDATMGDGDAADDAGDSGDPKGDEAAADGDADAGADGDPGTDGGGDLGDPGPPDASAGDDGDDANLGVDDGGDGDDADLGGDDGGDGAGDADRDDDFGPDAAADDATDPDDPPADGDKDAGDDDGSAAEVWVEIDYSNAYSPQSPEWTFSDTPGWGPAQWAMGGDTWPEAWDRWGNMSVVLDPIGQVLEIGSSSELQLMIGLEELLAYDSASVRLEGRSRSTSSWVYFDVYNPWNGCGTSGHMSQDWTLHLVDLDLGQCLVPGQGVQAVRVVPTSGTLALVRLRVTLHGAVW